MTDKPKTRAQLETDLELLHRQKCDANAKLADQAKRAEEARLQLDDLKERLANAELGNQFMRGYLARVREDDVVREDLIAVGDPAGEQQLVPKRKPTSFEAPSNYSDCSGASASIYDRFTNRPKPKHWVTY